MSAKDQIKQIVDYFKREPQLKDKTDGMAEGLLLGAQLADDANELSKETDASFKALQREYTENGNGSQTTAEITVARDGELVLDDRLKRDFGNVNAQLAEIPTKEVYNKLNSKVDYTLSKRRVNFSLDDFSIALADLATNGDSYTSIFDNEIFSRLRVYHVNYNAAFSLFVYTKYNYDIADVPDKFKQEFKDNSDWMKFGFHGVNGSSSYNSTPLSQFKSEYDYFITHMTRIAGEESLCDVIRLHKYEGSAEIMQALANDYGIEGVFAADDTRISYDLTTEENETLNSKLIIRKNNMNYYKTNMRIESLGGVNEVVPILNNLAYHNYLVIFTHDYALLQYDARIQEALRWLEPNGYAYNFFSGIQSPNYLPLVSGVESLPVTFGAGWSVRSGTELKVQKEGNEIKVQGQLTKTSDIIKDDPCINIDKGKPNASVVDEVTVFNSSQTVDVKAIIQTSGNITIGFRDKLAPAGLRDVAINISYLIN